MIVIETRGRNPQRREFTGAGARDRALAFLAERKAAADCAVIKATCNGRSRWHEWQDGRWVVH